MSGRYIILYQNLKFKNTDIGFFRRLTLLQLIKSSTKVCRRTHDTLCSLASLFVCSLIFSSSVENFLSFYISNCSFSPPLIYIFCIHARRSDLTTGANYVHRLWHSKLVGILSCSVVVFFSKFKIIDLSFSENLFLVCLGILEVSIFYSDQMLCLI